MTKPKTPKAETVDASEHDFTADRYTRIVQTTRSCRCPLTQDELLERSDRAAHLILEADTKQASLDNAKKQAKADLDRIDAEHRALSGHIRDRAEYRDVVCTETHDYRTWKITISRRDTGEVEDTRAMTLAERGAAQEELDLYDREQDDDRADIGATTITSVGQTGGITAGEVFGAPYDGDDSSPRYSEAARADAEPLDDATNPEAAATEAPSKAGTKARGKGAAKKGGGK